VTLLKEAFSHFCPVKGYLDALALENHTPDRSTKMARSLEGQHLKLMFLKQR
jgi:hypothetical protein